LRTHHRTPNGIPFPPSGHPQTVPLLPPPEPHLSRLHPVPVPVASYRASGSPPALTSSVLTHRHDTANVVGTHVESRFK
jgi:hypothetical protein